MEKEKTQKEINKIMGGMEEVYREEDDMEKEFNLSSKIFNIGGNGMVEVENLKEFIRFQKEEIISKLFGTFYLSPKQLELVSKTIDEINKELAGDFK